jgi:galactofuranose transport system substrate-binding protein
MKTSFSACGLTKRFPRGTDITIVSIDGVKAAFEAVNDGKLNCTVECNPLMGPQRFDLVQKVVARQAVPKRLDVQEGVYTQDQAKEALPQRQY